MKGEEKENKVEGKCKRKRREEEISGKSGVNECGGEEKKEKENERKGKRRKISLNEQEKKND